MLQMFRSKKSPLHDLFFNLRLSKLIIKPFQQTPGINVILNVNEGGVVSKETMVLLWWGVEKNV